MRARLTPIKGRGTRINPANRFEPIDYQPDPEAADPEAPGSATRFLRDHARTIIATNDSPDVGFDASINPYRGCEHGCPYCLDGDTLILMADGRSRPLRDVRAGDVVVGTRRDGHYRQYVESTVLDHWATDDRTAYRVALADGTELIASGNHRFLTDRGWKHVTGANQGPHRRPHLTLGSQLRGSRSGVVVPVGGGGPPGRRSPAGPRVGGTIGKVSLRVTSIERLPGTRRLYDITTSTGDFVANGVVSHNCYARPTHEYVGLSAGLDFETTIFVKERAPELLRQELADPGWQPQVLGVSGVTDAYQPVERRLELTRACLEVLAECRNPVVIVTKNRLVARDADLLGELAAVDAAAVFLTITTLDAELARVMEPRASSPTRRLEAIRTLSEAGIPTGVLIAPTIPGLTDHEIPRILEAVADHGGLYAGYALLRLPHSVKDIFDTWLQDHLPGKRDRVLNRIREVRAGQLTDTEWHRRMRGQGVYADHIRQVFDVAKRRHGFLGRGPELSTRAFRRPAPAGQLRLFDG